MSKLQKCPNLIRGFSIRSGTMVRVRVDLLLLRDVPRLSETALCRQKCPRFRLSSKKNAVNRGRQMHTRYKRKANEYKVHWEDKCIQGTIGRQMHKRYNGQANAYKVQYDGK